MSTITKIRKVSSQTFARNLLSYVFTTDLEATLEEDEDLDSASEALSRQAKSLNFEDIKRTSRQDSVFRNLIMVNVMNDLVQEKTRTSRRKDAKRRRNNHDATDIANAASAEPTGGDGSLPDDYPG